MIAGLVAAVVALAGAVGLMWRQGIKREHEHDVEIANAWASHNKARAADAAAVHAKLGEMEARITASIVEAKELNRANAEATNALAREMVSILRARSGANGSTQ